MKITFPSIAFCNLLRIFLITVPRLTIAKQIAAFCSITKAKQSVIFYFHPENVINPIFIKKRESIVEESGGQVHYIQPVCYESAVFSSSIALAEPDLESCEPQKARHKIKSTM